MADRWFPIQDGPSVPWSYMAPHEAQAKKNHGQDLEMLAKRGGLSSAEAELVVTGQYPFSTAGLPLDFAKLRRQWLERAAVINSRKRAYLLSYDRYGIFLSVASCATEAARQVNERLGLDPEDTETPSVSGSWDMENGQVLDVSRWWPHFTCNPPERHIGVRTVVEKTATR